MMEDWSRTAEQMMLSILESKARVLAVTSAIPAAGVSTIANGLASAFARSGRKSLLIDLTGTTVNGMPPVDWAPGEPLAADAIRFVSDNLSHLSVAPTPANRALFSNVEYFQKTFQRDLASYAHIILDLPAVLETDADRVSPVAAARAADAVVLVGLTGLTNRAELAEATQALRQVGANVAGLVLNDQYCPESAHDPLPRPQLPHRALICVSINSTGSQTVSPRRRHLWVLRPCWCHRSRCRWQRLK
jgi:Mrp family chromosome partitioning ATPase